VREQVLLADCGHGDRVLGVEPDLEVEIECARKSAKHVVTAVYFSALGTRCRSFDAATVVIRIQRGD
jgi:hypothetical protein